MKKLTIPGPHAKKALERLPFFAGDLKRDSHAGVIQEEINAALAENHDRILGERIRKLCEKASDVGLTVTSHWTFDARMAFRGMTIEEAVAGAEDFRGTEKKI
jgi:hypothetical protein